MLLSSQYSAGRMQCNRSWFRGVFVLAQAHRAPHKWKQRRIKKIAPFQAGCNDNCCACSQNAINQMTKSSRPKTVLQQLQKWNNCIVCSYGKRLDLLLSCHVFPCSFCCWNLLMQDKIVACVQCQLRAGQSETASIRSYQSRLGWLAGR